MCLVSLGFASGIKNTLVIIHILSIYKTSLKMITQYIKIFWPSDMLQAIRTYLQTKMDNRNNTTWLLVFLGFASVTNFTLSIIPLLMCAQVIIYMASHDIECNAANSCIAADMAVLSG